MGYTIQEKSWFANAVDLFAQMNESLIIHDEFLKKTTNLTKQIFSLAPKKTDLDEAAIDKLAKDTFKDLSGLPNDQRINFLLKSYPFKLVNTQESEKTVPINKAAVLKKLNRYEQLNGLNLRTIAKNQDAITWLCNANETLHKVEVRNKWMQFENLLFQMHMP